MESNDKLKEADGANRMCSYFDHITEIENFDFHNILIDEYQMKIFYFITFHKNV